MIRSLYTLNRNMNILQKKQENTSSNIANVNTTGYKFQNIIQSTLEDLDLINYTNGPEVNQRQELGSLPFGNQIDGVYTNFSQGDLYQTEKDTDLAIRGRGFFTVLLDNGQLAFTRNGNFKINENNQLITNEGYPVLSVDDNGQLSVIVFDQNNPAISNIGRIGNENRYLLIADFDDMNSLEKYGDTLYTSVDNQYNRIVSDISQGYIESSNVQIADEMVKMIEVSREFESNQKLLHSADETLSKAVNEIGKV